MGVGDNPMDGCDQQQVGASESRTNSVKADSSTLWKRYMILFNIFFFRAATYLNICNLDRFSVLLKDKKHVSVWKNTLIKDWVHKVCTHWNTTFKVFFLTGDEFPFSAQSLTFLLTCEFIQSPRPRLSSSLHGYTCRTDGHQGCLRFFTPWMGSFE